MLKKGDVVLFILLLLLGVGLMIFQWFPVAGTVSVTVIHDGQTVYSGPITVDKTITIKGDYTNVIRIEGGKVRFEESNCPGLDCVRAGAIGKAGQSVACLPNKTVVLLEAGEKGVDVVAK